MADIKAENITTSRPDYSLFENNCQNFVRFLLDVISPKADIWGSVAVIMNRLSNGGEDVRYPIPGAYPQSLQSTESNSSNSSFITSEGQGYPTNEVTTSSDVDKETPNIEETALFGHVGSHSPVPAVAASLSSDGQEPRIPPPSVDTPPVTLDPALFQSDGVLRYDIELAKKAQQAHQLGLGGFSAVYLVPSYSPHR